MAGLDSQNMIPTIMNLGKMLEYQEKAIVSRVLLKNEGGNLTFFAFDQGEELSEHSAPFDAFVQIIEGEAEIYISGKPYRLSKNDTIILPAKKPHSLKGVSRFKMLLTMIRQ